MATHCVLLRRVVAFIIRAHNRSIFAIGKHPQTIIGITNEVPVNKEACAVFVKSDVPHNFKEYCNRIKQCQSVDAIFALCLSFVTSSTDDIKSSPSRASHSFFDAITAIMTLQKLAVICDPFAVSHSIENESLALRVSVYQNKLSSNFSTNAAWLPLLRAVRSLISESEDCGHPLSLRNRAMLAWSCVRLLHCQLQHERVVENARVERNRRKPRHEQITDVDPRLVETRALLIGLLRCGFTSNTTNSSLSPTPSSQSKPHSVMSAAVPSAAFRDIVELIQAGATLIRFCATLLSPLDTYSGPSDVQSLDLFVGAELESIVSQFIRGKSLSLLRTKLAHLINIDSTPCINTHIISGRDITTTDRIMSSISTALLVQTVWSLSEIATYEHRDITNPNGTNQNGQIKLTDCDGVEMTGHCLELAREVCVVLRQSFRDPMTLRVTSHLNQCFLTDWSVLLKSVSRFSGLVRMSPTEDRNESDDHIDSTFSVLLPSFITTLFITSLAPVQRNTKFTELQLISLLSSYAWWVNADTLVIDNTTRLRTLVLQQLAIEGVSRILITSTPFVTTSTIPTPILTRSLSASATLALVGSLHSLVGETGTAALRLLIGALADKTDNSDQWHERDMIYPPPSLSAWCQNWTSHQQLELLCLVAVAARDGTSKTGHMSQSSSPVAPSRDVVAENTAEIASVNNGLLSLVFVLTDSKILTQFSAEEFLQLMHIMTRSLSHLLYDTSLGPICLSRLGQHLTQRLTQGYIFSETQLVLVLSSFAQSHLRLNSLVAAVLRRFDQRRLQVSMCWIPSVGPINRLQYEPVHTIATMSPWTDTDPLVINNQIRLLRGVAAWMDMSTKMSHTISQSNTLMEWNLSVLPSTFSAQDLSHIAHALAVNQADTDTHHRHLSLVTRSLLHHYILPHLVATNEATPNNPLPQPLSPDLTDNTVSLLWSLALARVYIPVTSNNIITSNYFRVAMSILLRALFLYRGDGLLTTLSHSQQGALYQLYLSFAMDSVDDGYNEKLAGRFSPMLVSQLRHSFVQSLVPKVTGLHRAVATVIRKVIDSANDYRIRTQRTASSHKLLEPANSDHGITIGLNSDFTRTQQEESMGQPVTLFIESVSDPGYSIDLLVQPYRLAIEVDGPYHYQLGVDPFESNTFDVEDISAIQHDAEVIPLVVPVAANSAVTNGFSDFDSLVLPLRASGVATSLKPPKLTNLSAKIAATVPVSLVAVRALAASERSTSLAISRMRRRHLIAASYQVLAVNYRAWKCCETMADKVTMLETLHPSLTLLVRQARAQRHFLKEVSRPHDL